MGRYNHKHFRKLREGQQNEILILDLETLEQREVVAIPGSVTELGENEVIVPENDFLGAGPFAYRSRYDAWVKDQLKQRKLKQRGLWDKIMDFVSCGQF